MEAEAATLLPTVAWLSSATSPDALVNALVGMPTPRAVAPLGLLGSKAPAGTDRRHTAMPMVRLTPPPLANFNSALGELIESQ